MELKLPPVVVFFIFALLMYLLAYFLPFGEFQFFGRYYLSYVLVGIAILIGLFSVGNFFKNKTTVDPTKPNKASSLVTGGIFAYSRNPMYLALLLVLVAFAIRLGNAFNILLAALFVSYMNRFQISPEEEALSKLFGKQYQLYKKSVRRWF
ncbi:isoprenylcysteine carboxylmethyltransferase family protein [Aurantibacter crassamenti]|uniref:methyltransferase family protein n=1 Tax=Aurantibacter crassamenti TaxID=1837375 RepID=UPI001939A2AD|nr:isoprenylcysteine carboxylmethyltransferase family protein [Aurantibacter crassamenti]MBM1107559.1 isoprenylcysteine carboxylmethyltransferase family protein [Aurantibacter crassamenti]